MFVCIQSWQWTPGGETGCTAIGPANNWPAGKTQDPRILLLLHAIICQVEHSFGIQFVILYQEN